MSHVLSSNVDTHVEAFQVPFEGNATLRGSRILSASTPHLLVLHGAGQGHHGRLAPLRAGLATHGIGSTAFDFIGHGITGGDLSSSSLGARTAQAHKIAQTRMLSAPLSVWGSSMGAYNALMLTKQLRVSHLILCVPAVYHPHAYSVPFGPYFSAIIRQPQSWEASDAWQTLQAFRGHLLILAAEKDEVIPPQISQRLYAIASQASSRDLIQVPGAGHQILRHLEASPDQFTDTLQHVASFLRRRG